MTVAEKLYQLRNNLNLSQKDFAAKAGVSQSAVNYWENGNRQPRVQQLEKIAKAFHISISFFLEDDAFDAIDFPKEKDELLFIDAKFQSIMNDGSLSYKDKEAALQDFLMQVELMASAHQERVYNYNKFQMSAFLDKLNREGVQKAMEQVEMLTKIPEYQKGSEPNADEQSDS